MMMMQKLTSVAATLAFLAAHAQAQLTVDPRTNHYRCPTPGGSYCLGTSLDGTVVIRCKEYIGTWARCGYKKLFDLPPRGSKLDAVCYQPDLAVGNAACFWNGTVYPDNGEPFLLKNLSTTAIPSATSKAGLKLSTVTSPESAGKTPIPSATRKAGWNVPTVAYPESAGKTPIPSATSKASLSVSTVASPEPAYKTSIPRATLEAAESPDINGPSQPLRDCTDSENFPGFELEGICHVTTSSRTSNSRTTSVAAESSDINGPSQPLRDCTDSENFPEFELEGICHVTTSSRTSIPLATNSTTPIPLATSSRTSIPLTTLKAELSPDINGPSQALRKCNDFDILPEFPLEGVCKFPSATYDISGSSKAKRGLATTVAPYRGSANMCGVGMSIVGAGVLAVSLFLLGN